MFFYVNFTNTHTHTHTQTLKKHHKLEVFENKVLWKIFGLKRDEGTLEWRRPPKEQLHDLSSSPNTIQVM
jgi:hypothetical protein